MHHRLRTLLVLVTMTLGLALFTFSAVAESEPQAETVTNFPQAAPGHFDEVSHTFPMADGTMREVTAWFDPTRISAEDALASVVRESDLPVPGSVSAAYAANKRWYGVDVPVVVQYNDVMDPDGLSGAPIAEWAMAQWNAVTDHTFLWAIGEPTDTYPSASCSENDSDFVNSVRFSTLLDTGVLGVTCTMFGPGAGGFFRMYEFDMQYDYWTDWSTGATTPQGYYDLPSVMLHEFGHALGLGHSSEGTVMQPYLGDGEQVRIIQPDDIAGLRKLYPASNPPTATNTATPTSTATSTPTSIVPPTSTPVLGNLPFRLYAIQAGRTDVDGPPPPTATPTRTATATPTSPAANTATTTPTQPGATSTATNTPTTIPTATPTQVAPGGVQVRNSTWTQAEYTDALYVFGEVLNGTSSAIEFVEITAYFYSASGVLLATGYTYSDVAAIPAHGDSPFWVILLDPPAGIASVTVEVTDYDAADFYPVVSGLNLQVTNTYLTDWGTMHIVGTVTNNSALEWSYVSPIVAFYDAQGRVVDVDSTYTTPHELSPGQSGVFDLLILNGDEVQGLARRFWVDARDY